MTFGYRNYVLGNYKTSYVNTPNYGPYNSSNYPSIVTNLNNGALNGIRPSPAEFSIMETGNDYSAARQTYTRVIHPRERIETSGKYRTPMSSSQIIHLKKIANIGKSSLKQGLPPQAYITNKCYDKNYVATNLKRARSSGCVPPKKCSSIYNRQFTSSNAFTQSNI
jgi:hypothetical protein